MAVFGVPNESKVIIFSLTKNIFSPTKFIYRCHVYKYTPYHKTFCGFPGYKPVPPGWFRFVCWFYDGNTQRLTESGFMEKPGIEPATPGLQGIALIHYTTGDSQMIFSLKYLFYDELKLILI